MEIEAFTTEQYLTAIVFVKNENQLPLKYRNVSSNPLKIEKFVAYLKKRWELDRINWYSPKNKSFIKQSKF